MAEQFIVARLDTKNGKAEFVPQLGVKRNATYVIILKSDGSEVVRLEQPQTLESIAAILDVVAGGRMTVAVKYPNVSELTDDAREEIAAIGIELLLTSNFNSKHHTEPFKGGITRIQARYRETLAGDYLVVTFDLPRNLKTIGGEITATEIVIGLNRDDHADSLFTIDIEGRVVEHAKYSGRKGIELLDAVKKSISKP